jgi:hypothetical protein
MTAIHLWFDDHSHRILIGVTIAGLCGGSTAVVLSLARVR